MPEFKNLTGKKFGELTVIKFVNVNKNKKTCWKVSCSCGSIKIVTSNNLVSGRSKSCGSCVKNNLVGKKFGELEVIAYIGKFNNGYKKANFWLCRDGNGFEKKMTTGQLTCGQRLNKTLPSTELDKKIKRNYNKYKNSVKYRKIKFKLTYQQFKDIILLDCYYCGIKSGKVRKSMKTKFIFNGIDRINNNKDYTVKNSKPCCVICNRAKSDMPLSEFRKYIKRLKDFNK